MIVNVLNISRTDMRLWAGPDQAIVTDQSEQTGPFGKEGLPPLLLFYRKFEMCFGNKHSTCDSMETWNEKRHMKYTNCSNNCVALIF